MRRPLLVATCILLLARAARAQQPTQLPGAPQPGQVPATPTQPAPVPPAPPNSSPLPPDEIIGRSYSVELRSGTSFIGKLLAASAVDLTFETQELGVVTIQRSNVQNLIIRSQEQTRRGYDYVGNGTRMFFAPTARNLRRGEGYVQDINVVLAGINYGLTDNISVGLLTPVIPLSGLTLVAVTPKVSAPITDNFSLGVGVLYAYVSLGNQSASGGIGYGVATYGTADTNLTLGLGYGFAEGDVSSSPVAVIGGNVRVSRRLFLVDETYIGGGGLGGLVGVRAAASRASGSVGVLYSSEGLVPAYLEFAYRFGKVK